jgi:hypothetical protein
MVFLMAVIAAAVSLQLSAFAREAKLVSEEGIDPGMPAQASNCCMRHFASRLLYWLLLSKEFISTKTTDERS